MYKSIHLCTPAVSYFPDVQRLFFLDVGRLERYNVFIMRKTPFIVGQFYHIYNRGVDGRSLFEDEKDFKRFLESIELFNAIKPVESIKALKSKLYSRRPTSGIQ